MKKLFITGGSGFLGEYLISEALGKFDIYTSYFQNPIHKSGIKTFQLDLSIPDQWNEKLNHIQPDIIIHTAANTNVDFCEKNPETVYQNNVHATKIIAKWTKQHNKRLIFTSTDMVFDGAKKMYKENDITNPINYYGKTKQLAEQAIQSIHPNYVIGRIALMYGPSDTKTSFLSNMQNKLKDGETISVFSDQYRTPVWVGNIAEALLELADHTFTGIIHLGGPERVSRLQFADYLTDILNISKNQINPMSMDSLNLSAKRPKDASLDTSLARSILKTKLLGCKEGLQKAYRF